METKEAWQWNFIVFLRTDRQSLHNRALAFVPGKGKHTAAPGVRLRLWGRGGRGGELGPRRKSHNKLEKKPATSRYSPSANGKGTKKTRLPPVQAVSRYTRKGPVTSPWGRGRGKGRGGVCISLLESKAPPGRLLAQSRPA